MELDFGFGLWTWTWMETISIIESLKLLNIPRSFITFYKQRKFTTKMLLLLMMMDVEDLSSKYGVNQKFSQTRQIRPRIWLTTSLKTSVTAIDCFSSSIYIKHYVCPSVSCLTLHIILTFTFIIINNTTLQKGEKVKKSP